MGDKEGPLKEAEKSASLQGERQTSGSCCHRSLEKDHVSRYKKRSNKFMDNTVHEQLYQSLDRRS